VVVGRIAQATDVDLCAVGQDSARVGVSAESPFAMIFAHSGISDTPKRQIVNGRLERAIVNVNVTRTCGAQDLFGY